jgi:transcriptional regulator with XRE-family HTH domain
VRRAPATQRSIRADAAEISDRLGKIVAARRELLGLTYDELADRTGCTKSHLWEIEKGRSRNPTLGTLIGLAEAFGTTPMALIAELCGEGEPPVADPALARVSAALAEARLLLRELDHRRTGDPKCSS